jgi:predicted amidophosphoribosyltransferase
MKIDKSFTLEKTSMKVCPKCRREYIDQFNFCPIDGEELSSTKAAEEKYNSESEQKIEKEEYDF